MKQQGDGTLEAVGTALVMLTKARVNLKNSDGVTSWLFGVTCEVWVIILHRWLVGG